MPNINAKVFEESRRHQVVTKFEIIPSASVLKDYQLFVSRIPSVTNEDVRIVEKDLLPFYPDARGKVYVKVPEITGAPKPLYALTGSPGAVSAARSGKDIFDFFDYFETYNTGNLAGQGGWTHDAGYYGQIDTGVSHSGTRSVHITTGDMRDQYLVSRTAGRLVCYMRRDNGGSPRMYELYITLNNGNTSYRYAIALSAYAGNDGYFAYLNSSGAWARLPVDTAWIANTWHKVEFAFDADADVYRKIVIDGIVKGTGIAALASTGIDRIKLETGGSGGYNGNVYWDDVMLMKYAYPEPVALKVAVSHRGQLVKHLGRSGS